jgi:thiol-disulfide isomerase/thioredoxin
MTKNRYVFAAVAALFIAIGIYTGTKHVEPAAPQDSAVARFLAQSMEDQAGKVQPLAQWNDKPLVINFWATWCAPCVDEMPELAALQTEIAPKNMQVIGIGIDSAANIAQFAAKHKITYPLYTGGMDGSELSRQFGNKTGALPFTVLIGRDGEVKKTYLGRLKMEELRKDLALL